MHLFEIRCATQKATLKAIAKIPLHRKHNRKRNSRELQSYQALYRCSLPRNGLEKWLFRKIRGELQGEVEAPISLMRDFYL